ncbi:MAG: hypothetical protein DRN68_02635 [Thaumarchaeota archaeon]|nr:MAG: hypothetical protein DRN68_02635 [Nitrososphaerota archaeon]
MNMRNAILPIALCVIVIGLMASIILASNPIFAQDTSTTTTPQTQTDQFTTLSIIGIGQVYYTPDEAIVTFRALGQGATAEEALSISASKASAIIDSLKDLGIEDEDIKTSGINVFPRYDFNVKPPKIVGYEATYTIIVRIRKIDLVGKAIDAAFSAGADGMYGVQFTLSSEEKTQLTQEAIKAAVEDAEEKAKIIADSLGMKIVGIKSVNLSSQPIIPIPRYETAFKGVAAENIPIEPGSATISASVSIVYLLSK